MSKDGEFYENNITLNKREDNWIFILWTHKLNWKVADKKGKISFYTLSGSRSEQKNMFEVL